MQIILIKDVEKLGEKHEVVTVKPGYGRNYLIPQGMAIQASDSNLRTLKELMRQDEARENKKLSLYREMASKIESLTLKIGAKSGTSGKIFGSVTNVQIANALKENGIEVERKKVKLPEEIKELGEYMAQIELHKQVTAPLKFEVIAE
ncbi:MAG: 50S ribosomal protein L9 [Saprospiraceae bacterium]|nr:50S ribosomal protein L9 [Saprospiraceae bacterium]